MRDPMFAPSLEWVLTYWVDNAREGQPALPLTFDLDGEFIVDECDARRRLRETPGVEPDHHDGLVRLLWALIASMRRKS